MKFYPVTFFKALSDPTRLKLVLLLRQHEQMCVCDLTQILAQPQPTISRHLNHLKRAGILVSERRGTWMWYALDPSLPDWCQEVIHNIKLDSDVLLDSNTGSDTECC